MVIPAVRILVMHVYMGPTSESDFSDYSCIHHTIKSGSMMTLSRFSVKNGRIVLRPRHSFNFHLKNSCGFLNISSYFMHGWLAIGDEHISRGSLENVSNSVLCRGLDGQLPSF